MNRWCAMVLSLLYCAGVSAQEVKGGQAINLDQVFEQLQAGREVDQERGKVGRLARKVTKAQLLDDDDKLFLTVLDSKYRIDPDHRLFSILCKKNPDMEDQSALLGMLMRVVQRHRAIIERHCGLLQQIKSVAGTVTDPPAPEWVYWYLDEEDHFLWLREGYAAAEMELQASIKRLQSLREVGRASAR